MNSAGKSLLPFSNECLIFQVLYSYSIGFVYILLGLAITSGLTPAIAFCSKVSAETEQLD